MNTRAVIIAAAAALSLAGCASAQHAASPADPVKPAAAMTPGMIMPDGSTMGAAVPEAATRPSAAAQMVCGAETHATIKQVLGLPSKPTSTSSWSHQLYTCNYRLPHGLLVLSVKESASPAAAHEYAAELRDQLAATRPLDGLTTDAYGDNAGKVVLVKDNDTLLVDATALPATVGTQQAKRFDFAYELASDILGCWTGDDGT